MTEEDASTNANIYEATSRTDSDFEFSSDSAKIRSPLTITLLFYIVTAGGILSACLRTMIGQVELTSVSILVVLIVNGIIGFLSGLLFGFFFFRYFKAAFVSASIGTIVGVLAGAVSMVGVYGFTEIGMIAFGGCWLMVLVMLFSARVQARASEVR